MRRKASRRGDRHVDFLNCKVFVFIFVQAGLLKWINCNPIPRGTRTILMRLAEKFTSLQTDSGFQLDLEIALSGVLATSNPAAHSALPNMP